MDCEVNSRAFCLMGVDGHLQLLAAKNAAPYVNLFFWYQKFIFLSHIKHPCVENGQKLR
jgi:hypothetical protein